MKPRRMYYIYSAILMNNNLYSSHAIARADFSMEKEGYTNHSSQAWMAVPSENMPEWAR